MNADDPNWEASRQIAAKLGATPWQLEVEPLVDEVVDEVPPGPPPPVVVPRLPSRPRLLPNQLPEVETPPPPERILEALLFVGGSPLSPQMAAQVIRGLAPEQVPVLVDQINARYRRQNRPYRIVPQDGGFLMVVRPAHAELKQRLYGGPREARLGPAALEVLSLVAYRQPISKADLDALRGSDTSSVLRQLVRLGLLNLQRESSAERTSTYQTTPRFLELFGLMSLEDLPRLGDTLR